MTEEQLREWYEENGLLFGQKVFETPNGFWVQLVAKGESWGIKCNDEAYRKWCNLVIHSTFEEAEAILTGLAIHEELTEVVPGT
ncbi:MAG: hypothetical protein IT190_07385 [Microbacteriaceae bacterium]|nr:hypothetical protein [Microbacteriaceae bacterium]